MLRAKGKFLVGKDFIKITTDLDFCRYYRALFNKAHWDTIKNQTPRYGAHIGICNPKHHKGTNCSKYKKLNGKEIWFDYDVSGNYGGFEKGFLNFWLNIFSTECETIAKDLGILKKTDGFAYFHITILSTKGINQCKQKSRSLKD